MLKETTPDARPSLRALFVGEEGALPEDAGAWRTVLLEVAATEEDALARLRREPCDGVLLRPGDRNEDPTRAVSTFRAAAPETPVLLVADTPEVELVRRAIRAGAQECIGREDLSEERLFRLITAALERERATAALRERLRAIDAGQTRFETMVEQNADGIVIVSQNGMVRFVNPAAENLFLRTAEELIGEPFGFPLLEGRTVELDLLRKDGSTVVAELRAAEIPWAGATAHLVTLRDVTDRKRAEERARELIREQEARSQAESAERHYRFLAEASEILESSLDYTDTLTRIAGLCVPRLADWCAIDLLEDGEPGRRVAARHPAREGDEGLRTLESEYPLRADSRQPGAEVLRTGEPLLAETVDGAWLREHSVDAAHAELLAGLGVASLLSVPLSARGRTVGVLTLVSTAPERHFDKRDLRLALELGRRAGMAVDNARLYRDAQLANRAKADFLAIMSHELRTPLNSIIGYIDILKSGIPGDLTERQTESLSRVEVASKHLLQLIEEILAYARMESGRESIRIEETDATRVLEEVVAVTEPLAREKGLSFRTSVPESGLPLTTDAGKVRQVLLNLVANAVKFTDEGEIRLEALDEGDRVVFRIADTGRGIAPEMLGRIFEPFWQIEQPKTRSAGGTGLGLSVARRLARLLGGDIRVESAPGVGSTFTVEVARRLPVGEAMPAKERVEGGEEAGPPPPTGQPLP